MAIRLDPSLCISRASASAVLASPTASSEEAGQGWTALGHMCFAVAFILSPVASFLSWSQNNQYGFSSYLISLSHMRARG